MASNLLNKLAKKTAVVQKETKSDTPTVEIPGTEENIVALMKFAEAKKIMRQYEAVAQAKEEILMPTCKKARVDWCMEHQEFSSTVKIMVKDPKTCDPQTKEMKPVALSPVNFTVQNKYSEIPIASSEKLDEIFKDEKQKCFMVNTEITVKPEGMKKIESDGDNEDGLLLKLIAACSSTGKKWKEMSEQEQTEAQEAFDKFFQVKQTLKPTDFMHEEQVKDSKIANMVTKAVQEGLIKPQKPSFRVF